MNDQVIGVKEFLSILNETLTFAYPQVTVEGEVSSFKFNQNKWVFFDLKDEDTTMGCFMPKYLLKVEIEDGMKVRVTGGPKITNWGKFSFTARSVQLAGEGELRRAFELLKARLDGEGLFAPERKRQLPEYPETLGLITSGTSAAYSDFMKILNQRWCGLTIRLADVQVQGAPAPDQIVAAINYFNQLARPVDTLVLIRGGGSLEDLQAFNTEAVARAVASSRTPILVGVGHEVDTSLADFAADIRAVTPTDAARLAVPDKREVDRALAHRADRLDRQMAEHLRESNDQLRHFIATAEKFLGLPRERTERLTAMLERDISYYLGSIVRRSDCIKELQAKLVSQQAAALQLDTQRMNSLVRVLSSFDPKATLRRGYAIVSSGGRVVKRVAQAPPGSRLVVQLSDGNVNSTVDHD
jgi:exodeoxyribonuclease VII large subunit